mgnify:FL=1
MVPRKLLKLPRGANIIKQTQQHSRFPYHDFLAWLKTEGRYTRILVSREDFEWLTEYCRPPVMLDSEGEHLIVRHRRIMPVDGHLTKATLDMSQHVFRSNIVTTDEVVE